jgi:arsenate reductase
MLDVLVVSEYNFGKNLIAGAYLKALGSDYFTVECAGFESGPLNPVVTVIMKLDGYDLSHCESPCSVFDLFEMGRRYDVVITVCPKRLDEKCPDFPGQLLRLNWGHSDPDKIAESRIDRIQQTRIMRDSIKADVINFINAYKEGKLTELK